VSENKEQKIKFTLDKIIALDSNSAGQSFFHASRCRLRR